MYAKHIALHEQDGYKAKKHTRYPTAAKLHGPIGRLQIKKVEWEPSWEPADIGIPQDMIDALDEARNAGDCINLARANCRRLDQDKERKKEKKRKEKKEKKRKITPLGVITGASRPRGSPKPLS